MAKANEDAFNSLHEEVTSELASRVQAKSQCSTADLRLAVDWLKVNNVTGVAATGTPLKGLLEGLTEGDQEFLERLTQ